RDRAGLRAGAQARGRRAGADPRGRGHDRRARPGLAPLAGRAREEDDRRRGQGVHDRLRRPGRRQRARPHRRGGARRAREGQRGKHRGRVRGHGRIPVTLEKPKFRKVFAKAASTWTSLGVAGTALVAAAALGSWPILAIGGAAYAALVAWDMSSPDFWKKALGGVGPEAARLPAPGKVQDPALRKAGEGILAARPHVAPV